MKKLFYLFVLLLFIKTVHSQDINKISPFVGFETNNEFFTTAGVNFVFSEGSYDYLAEILSVYGGYNFSNEIPSINIAFGQTLLGIAYRGVLTTSVKDGNFNLGIQPQIGLDIYGGASLYVGYNAYLVDNIPELRSRFNLSFGISPSIFNIFKSDRAKASFNKEKRQEMRSKSND